MGTFIKYINFYVPEQVITNEQLVAEFPEWSVKKIVTKVGVNKRYNAREDETASDLAYEAGKRLIEENGIDRNSIDFLLFCTQTTDYIMPPAACLLQSRLGLPNNCGAFDYNLGCSGFVYGLSLAKGLITAGVAKNILLLTGDTYSKIMHKRDKGDRSIIGDGASASLITTEGFAEVGNFVLGTDGQMPEPIIVKTGGMRYRQPMNDLYFTDSGNPVSSDYFYMDGPAVFKFTLDRVPNLVKDTLTKNNLEQKDIDLFVLHQANRYLLECLKDIMNIEDEKFYYCISEYGNTVSSTIPVALTCARKENILKGNILLAAFGVGFSWGGVVLRI
ncbi:MAG: ketoacyl-ACP synthase III [Dysgonamonadaceae bacterium]|jgi:3-oxoacyl-[acyl-carrier-protein] synthase-3|nr:ketoacyl-ACP synthase III [Dysgonamonadaceae bacterium]